MFEKWYALDPGSYQMHFYDYSQEKRISLRTCVAYQNEQVIALSSDALEYIYDHHKNIKVKYPVTMGKIVSDVSSLTNLATKEMKLKGSIRRPALVIVLPKRDAQLENQWVDALSNTGFRSFEFVTNAQILQQEEMQFYIHAGHSYTQMGFMVKDEEKMEKTIPFAGIQIDEQIQKIIAQKTNCLISNEDARALKELASSNLWQNKNKMLSCFAMNRYQQYEKIHVYCMDIWPAIENIEGQIVMWAKHCISTLPLEWQEKIMEKGIYLSGGLSNCFGLKQYLEYECHCSVKCTGLAEFDVIEKMKGWK